MYYHYQEIIGNAKSPINYLYAYNLNIIRHLLDKLDSFYNVAFY